MSTPIHFGWFLGQGFGVQGWRGSGHRWGYRWYQPDLWEQAARVLEQAGFDFLMFKDNSAGPGRPSTRELGLASAEAGPRHDPLLLIPLLLRATKHLGFIPTLNSTHDDPYIAARQIASLAHLDGPRVGLNVVTSGGLNFALPGRLLDPEETYERASEWVTVVKALWRSWDRDAVVEDLEERVYARADRLRPIDFHGRHFDVRGPAVSLPFADDGPVIVAPSNSERGLRFVGAHADIQFSPLTDRDEIAANRATIDAARTASGVAGPVRIFSGISPKVVGSQAEKEEYLVWRRTDESLRRELPMLSSILDVDLSRLDFDAPLPTELYESWTTTNASHGVVRAFLSTVDDPLGVPFRELAARTTHGHSGDIVGTAEEIADWIEEFVETSGVDGVLFDYNLDPESLYGILVPLVPVLRRRGVLRDAYGSESLRHNIEEF